MSDNLWCILGEQAPAKHASENRRELEAVERQVPLAMGTGDRQEIEIMRIAVDIDRLVQAASDGVACGLT